METQNIDEDISDDEIQSWHERLPYLHRPPYTYTSLICKALAGSSTKMLTLSEIYEFFMESFPYYRRNTAYWQNCVRHTLSLYPFFQKVPRSLANPGRGSFWMFSPMASTSPRPRGRPPLRKHLKLDGLKLSLSSASDVSDEDQPMRLDEKSSINVECVQRANSVNVSFRKKTVLQPAVETVDVTDYRRKTGKHKYSMRNTNQSLNEHKYE